MVERDAALIEAAGRGDVAAVRALLRQGASVAATDGRGRTALIAAAYGDHLEVGRLLIQAINTRDYPLVQGCILFISITYVAMNLLTDLTYGFLDPRIRFE